MEYFSYIINGDRWNFYLTEDSDNVVLDEENGAEVSFSKREVHFRRGDLDEPNVRHELWHIYFGYTFTRTADLSHHQVEEVSAELFAERGEYIVNLSKEIYNKLLEIRNSLPIES